MREEERGRWEGREGEKREERRKREGNRDKVTEREREVHVLKRLAAERNTHKQFAKTSQYLNAASNITGVLTDTVSFSSLLHKYGALSFWDYATAAPYIEMDMNPLVVR